MPRSFDPNGDILASGAYSFAASWILAKIVDKAMGLRVTPDQELEGLDTALHAESAYDFEGLMRSFGK